MSNERKCNGCEIKQPPYIVMKEGLCPDCYQNVVRDILYPDIPPQHDDSFTPSQSSRKLQPIRQPMHAWRGENRRRDDES